MDHDDKHAGLGEGGGPRRRLTLGGFEHHPCGVSAWHLGNRLVEPASRASAACGRARWTLAVGPSNASQVGLEPRSYSQTHRQPVAVLDLC